MWPRDIPEVLIVLGLLGSLGLALHNWMHRAAEVREQR
jgi:hypothetical protein